MIRSCALGLALAVALVLIAPSAFALPLQAFMNAEQEVPATPSLALGIAQLNFDPATSILSIEASVLGIEPDELTGFHIHAPAAPGENAGIILDLGIANWRNIDAAPPPGINGMVFSGEYDIGGLSQEAADAILSNNSYLNLHTFAFRGGEIRGQIIVVPEPSTAMLMALGLVGLRVGRQRQR